MRNTLVFLLSLAVFSIPATASPTVAVTESSVSWEGTVRVADSFYEVKMDQDCGEESCEMAVTVFQASQPVASAWVHLTPVQGEVRIGSRRFALDEETTARWLKQLRARSICGDFQAQSSAPGGCRSVDLHQFSEGWTGRIEETQGGEGREIRFYSLEEWPNPFGDLVSVGLRLVAE